MRTYAEVEARSLGRFDVEWPTHGGLIRRWLHRDDRERARKIHREAMRLLGEISPNQYTRGQLHTRMVRTLERQKRQIFGFIPAFLLTAIITALIQFIVVYLLEQLFAELDEQDAYSSAENLEQVTEEIVGHWMTGLTTVEAQE